MEYLPCDLLASEILTMHLLLRTILRLCAVNKPADPVTFVSVRCQKTC
jgi:hypothetical protein